MFPHFRQAWHQFAASPPGRRFQLVYERRSDERSSGVARWLWMGAGALVMAAGLVFLAIPGPGLVVLGAGFALVARESLWVARMLDRLELAVRPLFLRLRRRWRGASSAQRAGLAVTGSLLGLAAAALFYVYVMR